MKSASSLLLAAALALAAAPALARGEPSPLERGFANGRFVDEYYGITYEGKGLEKVFTARVLPSLLFTGRLASGVGVEVFVQETPKQMSGADWLAQAKETWNQSKEERTDFEEGAKPQPWALFVQKRADGSARHEGYAFYSRDMQCFVVHAWTDAKTASSGDDIRRALASLEVKDDTNAFVAADRLAKQSQSDPRDPTILARAAGAYGRNGDFENQTLALRAAQAALEAGKETFNDGERWQIAYMIARAQLDLGQLEDAVGSWKRSIELAKKTSIPEATGASSHYNLACTYARLGRRDDAFRELEATLAMGSGDRVKNLRESAQTDPDFESLRGDARWKKIFGKGGSG